MASGQNHAEVKRAESRRNNVKYVREYDLSRPQLPFTARVASCSATSVKAGVKRQRANTNTQTKNGSAVNRVVERVPRTAREGPEGSGRDLRETD